MSITISLNMIAWLSLALFWVILMSWPYPKSSGGSLYFPDLTGAFIATFRIIFGLFVTVAFMWVKIIVS